MIGACLVKGLELGAEELGGNWARNHASHTGGEGEESIRMSTTMLTK